MLRVMLIASLLVLSLEPFVATQPLAKVLVFSRTTGFRHDSIPDGINAVRQLGQAANSFAVDATEDPAAFTDANLAQYRAVVFLSTTGEVLNDAQQAAFERFVRAGNGFAGVHSASDTEYDWPWYGGLVGAYFKSHPAIQSGRIKIEDASHPATQTLPATWTRTDEWYDFRTNPRGRVRVLATLDEASYQGGMMGADHPIAWCQAYDGGRAWYTAGGHTRESYGEPLFRQHLLGGIEFAAGLKPGKCEMLAAVSSASYRGESLARASIVSLFGSELAATTQSAAVTPLPTMLASSSLQIKDSAGLTQLAPLFFASPGQMNWLLPATVSNGLATLTLLRADGTRPSATVNVTTVAPALFAANANGQGVASGFVLRVRGNLQTFEPLANFDATLNRYLPVPVEFTVPDESLFLILFGTGIHGHDGLAQISLRAGGVPLTITYAGAQGDFVGLDQINAQIPRGLAGRGELQLELTINGQLANVVTMIMR